MNSPYIKEPTVQTFSGPKLPRKIFFMAALLLRLLLASVTLDHFDGPVFLSTGYDLLVRNTPIYTEDSLQKFFNYPPLAYAAIIPGQAIFFGLGLRSHVTARIFLKLPFILGDLLLAWLFGMRRRSNLPRSSKKRNQLPITSFELFILFNPLLIYVGSIKGQFDIIAVLLMVIALQRHFKGQDLTSGFLLGTAFLVKHYGAFAAFFVGVKLLKKEKRRFFHFCLGIALVVTPVFLVCASINLSGMINHAFLAHLHRLPSGYSPLSMLWKLSSHFPPQLAIPLQALFGPLSAVMLVLGFLYLARRLWEKQDLLITLQLAFIFFCLLNKVFWDQYLVPILALWLLNQERSGIDLNRTQLAWTWITLPLVLVIRIDHMIPPDIKGLIGPLFAWPVWIAAFTFHFMILLIARWRRISIFTNRTTEVLYYIMLALAPIHLFFELFTNSYGLLLFWMLVILWYHLLRSPADKQVSDNSQLFALSSGLSEKRK